MKFSQAVESSCDFGTPLNSVAKEQHEGAREYYQRKIDRQKANVISGLAHSVVGGIFSKILLVAVLVGSVLFVGVLFFVYFRSSPEERPSPRPAVIVSYKDSRFIAPEISEETRATKGTRGPDYWFEVK